MSAPQQTTTDPAAMTADDDVGTSPPSASPPPVAPRDTFASAGHEALFEDDGADEACDVCGARVQEDSGEGHDVPGRALYVWSRGDATRYEEPPLCPSCASALGLTALARWEIEEEEG